VTTRRAFLGTLAGGLLAAPFTADAQPAGKVYRVGYLTAGSVTANPRVLEAFRQGLRELGWVEGQNIVIEYRSAEGHFDRLPDLAAELVRLKVDVIVAAPTPAVLAAKSATGTVPIVGVSLTGPVELGLIASLARPGGNVTGVSYSVGTDIFGKDLELLKEIVPKVRRVAVLSNPDGPGPSRSPSGTSRMRPGRWGCSFSSWRHAGPGTSTAPSRRWRGSAWGHCSS